MIKLAVFDIAGTTVRDNDEVLFCFSEACREEGINAPRNRLNALMGVSKLEVFGILWQEQLGADTQEVKWLAERSYRTFRTILENYYLTHEVQPTEGALAAFQWLRARAVRVALNTGFYRVVTDIILQKLDWHSNGNPVDFVVCSDEVPKGRPEPFMIRKAMDAFGVTNPGEVIKIGDTPVDLLEGRNAGCRCSIAVTNGTHSRDELALLDNDGLIASLLELPEWLQGRHLL
ncbi:MAG TPA: HAD hydrolase-like protein [Saprospiraceae bacterium]|nr:HAD hydrolase-like protein [Saprospiraceae bacterium]HNM24649.1 HAD hydrolase-like protein [Saprospiraceae bacterium]